MTKTQARSAVLYALSQGILYPQTPDMSRQFANIVEELDKVGMVDYTAAMEILTSYQKAR